MSKSFGVVWRLDLNKVKLYLSYASALGLYFF